MPATTGEQMNGLQSTRKVMVMSSSITLWNAYLAVLSVADTLCRMNTPGNKHIRLQIDTQGLGARSSAQHITLHHRSWV